MSRDRKGAGLPERPVRIIVGYPPGGAKTTVARFVAQWLQERLAQPFIVENRPGAANNLATEAVVRAPGDGYTLLLADSANAINATLYDKLNFNFIRDIAPVASIMAVPLVIEVNPAVPAKQFLSYRLCQGQSGQDQYGSAVTGTPPTWRRIVQIDGGRRHCSRAVSGWRTCTD